MEIPKSEPFTTVPVSGGSFSLKGWPSLTLSFATTQARDEWLAFVKNIRREQAGLDPLPPPPANDGGAGDNLQSNHTHGGRRA